MAKYNYEKYRNKKEEAGVSFWSNRPYDGVTSSAHTHSYTFSAINFESVGRNRNTVTAEGFTCPTWIADPIVFEQLPEVTVCQHE